MATTLVYNDAKQRHEFSTRVKQHPNYEAMTLDQAWDWYYTTRILEVYSDDFKKILSLNTYNVDETMKVFEGELQLENRETAEFFLAYAYDGNIPTIIVNYKFPFN
ncbi:hypothetical protein [Mesoplasma lactucae]|uniref:Uncharacterized protein n=1 Tax=Mesoplasma lactucae ATCC 49193 TaxID=81460 RepID=A0A291IR85_9MOLU|nr:hypothetical protein [Mesoplasma lactucae]ATG97197.1 hypothetical protein CP520_00250 [Mesoplasma lactucae ATCC 49193]ATZ20362.1 hypothetical protein MLACT_v1c05410 [Mesoplasma lactucae ATCC 49193]MCL8216533.1 hypothetical protein [Mesoplasma lactucae ATCC 49193]